MNTLYVKRAVLEFVGREFSKEDQEEIALLFELVRDCPELGAPVRSMRGVLYRKTYCVNRHDWPHGVRVLYVYKRDDGAVFVIDVGDHTRCATNPRASVYRDEREAMHG